MKKTKLLLIFSILALFTTSIALLNIVPIRSMTESISDGPVVFHVSTIYISDNGDFVTNASSGDGSASTPWIFENLVLNGNGTGYIFDIRNTTDHFIIRNCLLYNTTSTAMYFYDAGNGTILNNTITDCNNAIEIEDSSNFRIINNTLTLNGNNGVETNSGVNYLELRNNTITHNGGYGVYLWGTNHSIITENTIINNTNQGMALDDTCTNNTIAYNTLNNNTNGLYMTDTCSFNRIQYNVMNNNSNHGINIYDRWCNYNTFLNNTANFNGDSGIYSDESSHNTFINNVANRNQYYGVNLASNSFNYTFINNEASFNLGGGFFIENANNSLTYNRANNNTGHGVHLSYSANNTLTLNTANGNSIYGIFVDNCDDETITWNVLHQNSISIIATGSTNILQANNSIIAATLISPYYTPQTGDINTPITFSCLYTDPDNLEPFSIRVFIDGVPYDMVKINPADDIYTDGCGYKYTTTLSEGSHVVSFEVFDITHKVTITQMAGPTISAPPIPGFELLMLLVPLMGLTLAYFVFKKQKLS